MSWLPLIAGVAMRETVAEVLPRKKVTLKWPNDVQVEGLKICGILSELLPSAHGVVIGAGLNLTLEAAELPTDQSTSLLLQGLQPNADEILARYLSKLKEFTNDFSANPDRVRAACSTIGLPVKAILPGEAEVLGTAVGIDEFGRLLIQVSGNEPLFAVSAGDVVHLRHN